MSKAADHLEKLAKREYERKPPLPVAYCMAAPGPAVGPGGSGESSAVGFEPATWPTARDARKTSNINSVLRGIGALEETFGNPPIFPQNFPNILGGIAHALGKPPKDPQIWVKIAR